MLRKLKATRQKASRASRSRLAFYREDIEALHSILERLAAANQLDGCLVTSPRHEVLLAEHGTLAPQRRQELIREKRKGLSLGWNLRLICVTAGVIRPVEPAAAEELRRFLREIAARKESGERITTEFGRPTSPRRA